MSREDKSTVIVQARAEDVTGNEISDQSLKITRDSTAPDGAVGTGSIWE